MSNIVKKAIGVLKSPKKRTIILAQHDITVAKNAIIWTTPCKESLQLVA